MKKPKYTKYELEVLDYMEGPNPPKTIPNVKQEIERYREIAKRSVAKKAISLRLSPSDLEGIKSKALIEGIPYQTLISSVIHKYVNGTLVERRN